MESKELGSRFVMFYIDTDRQSRDLKVTEEFVAGGRKWRVKSSLGPEKVSVFLELMDAAQRVFVEFRVVVGSDMERTEWARLMKAGEFTFQGNQREHG
ncbi:hypothetical protein ACP70R_009363 [Stipagrostis hirtigluma subsp. patula]